MRDQYNGQIPEGDSMEGQKRGQRTKRIKDKSKELLGCEISRNELSLMAYIDYTMKNTQKINPQHCNQEDREILRKWKDARYIKGGASGLALTKEFYDIIQELLFLGYVDLY